MLTHHRLKVYEKALALSADAEVQKALPARVETTQGGELLSRVVAMLTRI